MTEWTKLLPIKILVTGGGGQVAHDLVMLGKQDSHFDLITLDASRLDVASPASIQKALDLYMPDYVVNTVAFNNVDAAEHDTAFCYQLNATGVKNLAVECGALSIPLIHLSTDHLFDGHYASGYSEDDEVSPLGVFGESKRQGEELLRQYQPKHIILRVSWIFSARGDNYLLRTLEKARTLSAIETADDRQGCPTSAVDVGRVILAIIKQLHNGADAWGTYHYCGAEVTTRYRFTEAILAAARQYEELKTTSLVPVSSRTLHAEVDRPASSVLQCKKLLSTFGIRQRPWRNELVAVLRQIYKTKTKTEAKSG
ncbi:dTDP-4-dehydrorhamnose reductase [Neptunomonas qingdaonensis]|uniref:dTDP-4-dehydrorhamnose reductase n=1 Tax=Neptunomonas qingdaonensis TaxID=1045558 RepID=A0A1I2VGW5_9GAMM|nr:dTDP-4-dehydrorhamnose reductase [Neptunomonas qingdaonensis]SFG88564.1 dTDP-4-dehydrorhamnose reductase [Neptunomonas qingdaonensis]